jgi:hypothetical protein
VIALTPSAEEGPGLLMQHVSPMVYLDHWALRKFADAPELRSRFLAALRARVGTLALSWLNLAEFAAVSHREQRRAAEAFLEAALPAIFCIDVDLAAVDKRMNTGDPLPHADRELLLLFRDWGGSADKRFTAIGLCERLYDSGLAQTKEKLATTLQGRLEYLRETYRTDRSFREAVRHAEHGDALAVTTRTRAIARTLAATFFPDYRRVIKPNDAVDFLHTAIPVAYCDLVLLDGDAADRVERARRKLGDKGVKMAEVFPGRRDGVDRFLAHLRAV